MAARSFQFKPGQFNMLYLYGVGEVPISISGDPARSNVLVHTTRAVGTVTKVMSKLKVGDMIGVRGPYGTAWPVEEAVGNDVVIVAGGIGLAPLRPASLPHSLAIEPNTARWCCCTAPVRRRIFSIARTSSNSGRAFDLEVHVTVDRAMGNWRGNVGVVTNLIPKAPFDPTSTVAMVCGPEIMMRFTVLGLQKRGVALETTSICRSNAT